MKKYDIFDAINTKKLLKLEEYDIAKLIQTLPLEKQLKIFHLIPSKKRADVLTHLEKENAYQILISLDKNVSKSIINDIQTDDIANLIEALDNDQKDDLINLLKGKKKEQIVYLLKYQDNSAKAMMTSEYIIVDENKPIGLVLKEVIAKMKNDDYIDVVFYVDNNNHLIGTIQLRDLITSNASDLVETLVNKNYISCYEYDSINTVIEKVSDYDMSLIPVLSEEQELTGIITADDILSEIKENYEDALEAVTGASLTDEDKPVIKRTLSRLPWLIFSIVCNLLIAGLLTRFENTINAVWALVFFQPMILGMAGNIGNQSLAITILGLSSGILIKKENTKKHIRKEVIISLLNALFVSVIGFVFAFSTLLILNITDVNPYMLGLVVGITLFISLFVSGTISTLLPIGFFRTKIDPISASGPTLSTINDLISLLTYVIIATILLL